jgi:hypothetical protein
MLRTIFVVYTDSCTVDTKCTTLKKYAFNTSSKVKVGDRLNSNAYSTKMVVTDVLDEVFTYYNKDTGKLSNRLDSTSFRTIKVLKVASGSADVDAIKVGNINK